MGNEEKKKENLNNDENTLLENIEIKVSNTFNQPVSNASSIVKTFSGKATAGFSGSAECTIGSDTYRVDIVNNNFTGYNYDRANGGISLDDLRMVYKDCGSIEETYKALKNHINVMKELPETMQSTINLLLHDFRNLYDSNLTKKDIGTTQEERLKNILETPKDSELSGFVCTDMHGFIMETLHDCGIEAGIINGMLDDHGHAVLIYKIGDGKYVYNNYGTATTIEASNIKSALKEVYKRTPQLFSTGKLEFATTNESHSEYLLTEEAAFGNEIDKRELNTITPNLNFDERSIGVNLDNKSNGGITANLTFKDLLKAKSAQLDVAGEYRSNNETDSFLESESFGGKVYFQKEFSINPEQSLYLKTKGIASSTKGVTGGYENEIISNMKSIKNAFVNNALVDYVESMGLTSPIERQSVPWPTFNKEKSNSLYTKNYTTASINASVGVKEQLREKISHSTELTGLFNYYNSAKKLNGAIDYRVALEHKIDLEEKLNESTTLLGSVNTGFLIDHAAFNDNISTTQVGGKVNGNLGGVYNTDNVTIAGDVSLHGAGNKTYNDMGIQANLNASVKPPYNPDKKINLNLGVFKNRQKLNIGGFNDVTENATIFNAQVGIDFNKKVQTSLNYQSYSDKTNLTLNFSQIGANVKINF